MTTIFARLLKATAQGALVVFAFLPMPSSAALMFELDFGCTNAGNFDLCTDGTSAGGGTITFPELGPASPAAPFPGVDLDLTFLIPSSLSFTEADITSIAWTISPDMSTLAALDLTLDTDPLYALGDIGEHQYASVLISMDQATWYAAREGCTSAQECFSTITYEIRTVTASPAAVPLPPAFTLFSIGLAGLGLTGRRKKV